MPTDKRQRQRENSRARQEAIRAAQKQSARRRQIVTTVLAIAAIVGVLFLGGLIGNSGDDDKAAAKKPAAGASTTVTTEAPEEVKPGTTPCPPAEGAAERKVEFDGPPKDCLKKGATYVATVTTDVGVFKVELDSKNSPNTANNFVFLARHKFFDGVTFHRVIPGFVIQGGDPQGNGQGGPGYAFNDEIPEGHKYAKGDIVMANSGPNTQGSQFFVVTGPQGEGLPPQYSPFGKVIEGLDVVMKIDADGNDDPAAGGVPPKVLHKMLSVTITES